MGHQADPTEAGHFLEESLSLQRQDFEDSGWSLQTQGKAAEIKLFQEMVQYWTCIKQTYVKMQRKKASN